MRQLTLFDSEPTARTLAAYLVTERIAAHVDTEQSGYSVWIRDEDQLPRAREILEHFRQYPADPRYHGAEKSAETIRREEERRRREQKSNVVEMRGRWGSGGGIKRRCPVVLGMIAISVLVAVVTYGGEHKDGRILDSLLFVDPTLFFAANAGDAPNFWSSLMAGQVWRLVTPIFIHFGIAHLVFNMWALFVLGGQVEDRRGSLRFALLALVLAIASNLGESITSQLRLPWGLSMFGGMSGVVYGIFGYVWMKVKFDNSAGYQLAKESVFIMIVWFVLCILRDFPPFDSYLAGLLGARIANTAHAVGLFLGMAIAYAPVLLRKRA